MRSHRWITSEAVDVDAYLLTDNSWMLFAYVADEKLVDDVAYWRSLTSRFAGGGVRFISRALKIEKKSEPLAPIAIDPKIEIPAEVWCKEGWMRYRLETRDVLNPGVFLDQALNRERLVELVQQAYSRRTLKETDGFLNLFSYTGAFTIAALCAGLKQTTSVDVSSRYLNWEKLNFDANFGGLEVEHKLINDDARDYLQRSVKRGTKYRWIVIDPPTFSRGQKKMFKVQDELLPMVELAYQCLQPGGAILASTNDARWDKRDFTKQFTEFAREKELELELGSAPKDFGSSHPLKSAWLLSAQSTA